MKILIAFDGSECSEAALDDLVRAGLPDTGQATVLSVAEVWLPAPISGNGNGNGTGIALDAATEQMIENHHAKGRKAVAVAEIMANHAKQRVVNALPAWTVEAEATYGSPAWEIVSRAAELGSDLIIVGSHGRTGIKRLMLGSVSQKVLTEAPCSVRIARGRIEVDPGPVRILIGFDGTEGATAAVEAVAGRNWPRGSEVRLVSATDPVTPSCIGRFIPPVNDMIDDINSGERKWLVNAGKAPLIKLREKKLAGSHYIHAQSPKSLLTDEAANWHADCVFVGANSLIGRIERFILGSVSAAVAARANCSVEVVRTMTAS